MAGSVMRLAVATVALGVMAGATASAQTTTVPVSPPPVQCPAGAKDLPLTKPGTLTMSINATIPPSQYIDKSGKIVGMSVDFGNEIARRLCVTPEYANVQFEVQIPGLQNKRWDMIDTGLFFTPARAKVMQLIPYTVNALSLIVPEGNPKGVKEPKDLRGQVGRRRDRRLRREDAAEPEQRAGKGRSTAHGHPRVQHLRRHVPGARCRPGGGGLRGRPDRACYQKQGKFTMAVSGLFPGSPLAFATSDTRIAAAVTAALAAMVADGTYKQIMDYYGAAPIDKWARSPGKIQYYYTP